MQQLSYITSLVGFVALTALWFLFAAVFLLRKKSAATMEQVKHPLSFVGLALQGVGFLPVWSVGRTPMFSPFVEDQYTLNIFLQIIAIALAAFSVWLAMSAVRELGRQWSLQARLVDGHKLITSGVYQMVRHPIYTAMLGMLISTGIVNSRWWVLLGAVAVFIVGTRIRTVSEENLLAEAFGRDFVEWKKRVPGLIPFLRF